MDLHAGITSEVFTPDNFVAQGVPIGKKVTVASGAGVLAAGTVLGKVTVSSKYLKSLAAAGDGSEAPDMILAHEVDASEADVEAMVYFSGVFNADALTIGTGHTAASIFEGLRGKGIYLVNVA